MIVLLVLASLFALTVGVAFAGKSTLGDFVWDDANGNGVKDNGEQGINGVKVNLYQDGANGQPRNGIITPAELISMTFTANYTGSPEIDTDGYYKFDIDGADPNPQLYRVEIDDSNFLPGGPLEGYVYTGQKAGNPYNGPEPRDVIISASQIDYEDADFPYYKARARLTLTPGEAANQLGDPHVLTVTLEIDDATLTPPNFLPAAGQNVTVTIVSGPGSLTPGSGVCVTNGSGQCTVTLNSAVTGTTSLSAFWTGVVSSTAILSATSDSNTGTGTPDPSVKRWVDAELTLEPAAAANQVGDPHVMTATLRFDKGDGSGFQPAPDGQIITGTVINSSGANGVLNSPTCTTSGGTGTCQLILNATAPGLSSVTAAWNGLVSTPVGSAVADDTSAPALKRWVDARLILSPQQAANQVGDPHTVTAQLQYDNGDGLGWVAAPAGQTVNFTVTNSLGATGVLTATSCVTNGSGQCSVVLNSTTTGLSSVSAAWNGSISTPQGSASASAQGDTDTSTPNTADPSVKRWVDVRLNLTPDLDSNAINDPHTFTATLEIDDGDGTGFQPASGQSILFTKSGAGSAPSPNPCVTNGSGQCTTVVNSASPGTTNLTATWNGSISPSEGVVTITNLTDGATKVWVNPNYIIVKQLNTPNSVVINQPISFTIFIQNTGSVTITALPLRDTYNSSYLQFVSATPGQDSQSAIGSTGVITWSDLTVSLGDIAPSQIKSVIVNFIGISDTTTLTESPCSVSDSTCNVARSQGGEVDPDGPGPIPPVPLPPKEDSEPVQIINPTAVTLVDRVASKLSATSVMLAWGTTTEADILGFNIKRYDASGNVVQVNDATIAATNSGSPSGASYSFIDNSAVKNTNYTYELEVLTVDGAESALLGRVFTGSFTIYLPLTTR
ncbi:MAG: hypothetical protein HC802_06225 [Caldilineaceae bacterium]|nr:hypothetical protein [Caldilineaceae bacterium]